VSGVAFCFPGQGSIEAGMGLEIAEASSAARDVFAQGSEASGLDLERLCFAADQEELVDTAIQQPALVATSLAFLEAVKERLGIVPDFVVGHSVGEFAALAAAESMTIKDALALVRERGMAMAEAARQKPGSMAAILGLEDGWSSSCAGGSSACGRRTTTVPARSSSPVSTTPSTSASSSRRRRVRVAQ